MAPESRPPEHAVIDLARERARRSATSAEDAARAEARRLRFVTRAILAVGFTAAIAIYFVNRARPENPLGYEPLETKQYLHDLELYGGQANVLAAEFREWFSSLWYGRRLAFTIAAITLLLVPAVRFGFAMRAAPGEQESGDVPSDGGHHP